MGWHDERFEQSHNKIRFDCVSCGRNMFFPPSKLGKYLTCSAECKKEKSLKQKETRRRFCLTCKKVFYPRSIQIKDGIGLYCSHKCSIHLRVKASLKPEARQKQLNSYMLGLKEGRIKHKVGVQHPNWKGGKQAASFRYIESGAKAAYTKLYRKRNPDKVAEFTKKRNSKKIGKLPRGTIKKIGDSQKWLCVICRKNILNSYHVDHIIPLAKGGMHEPKNIQILCPSCNVRKSAKDPIDYMQERGFLL